MRSSEVPLSRTGPTTPLNIPSSDVYVQIDTSTIQKKFNILPNAMGTAARRAADRTRDWLLSQLTRELAARAALPKEALKGRFRRGGRGREQAYSTAGYAILWIGLDGIEAQKAGKTYQNEEGTKVGKHFFDRAFIAEIFTAEQKVWRRKSFGAGSQRFPVVKMTIPINETMEEILPKYQAEAGRMFSQRLMHEVNYLISLGNK